MSPDGGLHIYRRCAIHDSCDLCEECQEGPEDPRHDGMGALRAYGEALRAVRVLHTGAHYCGMPPLPPRLWAGEWPGPCPTAVIIDAALSGYGRGGAWPYAETAPPTADCPAEHIDPTGWYACGLGLGHPGHHHDPKGATWPRD